MTKIESHVGRRLIILVLNVKFESASERTIPQEATIRVNYQWSGWGSSKASSSGRFLSALSLRGMQANSSNSSPVRAFVGHPCKTTNTKTGATCLPHTMQHTSWAKCLNKTKNSKLCACSHVSQQQCKKEKEFKRWDMHWKFYTISFNLHHFHQK